MPPGSPLAQVEGAAEHHRTIGPWQALLGEPDWKQVDELGELGVEQLLEGRPGEAATTVSLEERTEVGVGCWLLLAAAHGIAVLCAGRPVRCGMLCQQLVRASHC